MLEEELKSNFYHVGTNVKYVYTNDSVSEKLDLVVNVYYHKRIDYSILMDAIRIFPLIGFPQWGIGGDEGGIPGEYYFVKSIDKFTISSDEMSSHIVDKTYNEKKSFELIWYDGMRNFINLKSPVLVKNNSAIGFEIKLSNFTLAMANRFVFSVFLLTDRGMIESGKIFLTLTRFFNSIYSKN